MLAIPKCLVRSSPFGGRETIGRWFPIKVNNRTHTCRSSLLSQTGEGGNHRSEHGVKGGEGEEEEEEEEEGCEAKKGTCEACSQKRADCAYIRWGVKY